MNMSSPYHWHVHFIETTVIHFGLVWCPPGIDAPEKASKLAGMLGVFESFAGCDAQHKDAHMPALSCLSIWLLLPIVLFVNISCTDGPHSLVPCVLCSC